MTHRERVMTAVNHQEPDRVPCDLAGTKCTSLHRIVYENVRKLLQFETKPPVIWDVMQQIVLPDEDILEYFDIDTRSLYAGAPDHFIPPDLGPNAYQDEWGVIRTCPDGGYYFDLAQCPFEDEPGIEALEHFPWPDPDDPGRVRGLRERAAYLHEHTDYAVVLNLGATILHTSQYMRGFEGWFVDLAARPEFMHALMDKILDVHLRTIRNIFREVDGRHVDIAFIADDLAGDAQLMISPRMYRTFLKPRHQQLIACIRDYTQAKIMYHSCGAVRPLIPDLIEIGVEILNPIQTTAKGMNPASLKAEFGDQLTFWGGIDTREILPHGSVEDVAQEVRQVIHDLGAGGGYVLNFVHNAQPDVKPENVCAMFAAGKINGAYPLR
ncbi:uroporphyrinogen-III decarboxylase [Candidatus Vecturithrix granuli]|uniref:Uroporphyrinogen-III decarboxylase n=1 Tax=Vecturithrix granuli TaxID=1499967 RepID=A0A081C7Q8_VECG1|nr:uroporphyrinogen-III decarboxylase [Candidatus Vecturithrix granuli]